MGFAVLGPRVLRADRLERVAAAARRLARQGPFAASAELASLAGAPAAELQALLAAMGYRASAGENGEALFHTRRHRPAAHGKQRRRARPHKDGPFAKLKELRLLR